MCYVPDCALEVPDNKTDKLSPSFQWGPETVKMWVRTQFQRGTGVRKDRCPSEAAGKEKSGPGSVLCGLSLSAGWGSP